MIGRPRKNNIGKQTCKKLWEYFTQKTIRVGMGIVNSNSKSADAYKFLKTYGNPSKITAPIKVSKPYDNRPSKIDKGILSASPRTKPNIMYKKIPTTINVMR